MVIMQGTSRVFTKPFEELEGSTSSTKNLNIYGITNYDELVNTPIEIRSSTIVSSRTRINVNSLGPIDITYKGSTSLPDGWTSNSLIYRIMYNGNTFMLLSYSSGGSSESSGILSISSAILSLTNDSSSEDILDAFDGESNIRAFIEAIRGDSLVLLGGLTSNTSIETNFTDDEDNNISTETIRVIQASSKLLRSVTFTRSSDSNTYSSVKVIDEALGGGGSNSIFIIPSNVLSLTSSSTSDEVIEAFGGLENIQVFEENAYNKNSIIKLQLDVDTFEGRLTSNYLTCISSFANLQGDDLFAPYSTCTLTFIDENNITYKLIYKHSTQANKFECHIEKSSALVSDGSITKIVKISQTDYNALTTKESTTLYIVE